MYSRRKRAFDVNLVWSRLADDTATTDECDTPTTVIFDQPKQAATIDVSTSPS